MLLEQGNKSADPRKSLFELVVCKESCLYGMPVYVSFKVQWSLDYAVFIVLCCMQVPVVRIGVLLTSLILNCRRRRFCDTHVKDGQIVTKSAVWVVRKQPVTMSGETACVANAHKAYLNPVFLELQYWITRRLVFCVKQTNVNLPATQLCSTLWAKEGSVYECSLLQAT